MVLRPADTPAEIRRKTGGVSVFVRQVDQSAERCEIVLVSANRESRISQIVVEAIAICDLDICTYRKRFPTIAENERVSGDNIRIVIDLKCADEVLALCVVDFREAANKTETDIVAVIATVAVILTN